MYYIRENNDLDRHLKKRYCHCCGRELETRWVEKPFKEQYIEIFGERYYYIRTFGKWCFYDDKIVLLTNEYHCSDCDKSFSVYEQRDIIQAQKELDRNILSEQEIANSKEHNLLLATQKIKDMRWLSWIPCLGGIALYWKAFSYPLSKKSKGTDSWKILVASFANIAILLLAWGILFKIVSIDGINPNIQFILKRVIPQITSLWSFNLPILWYINNRFPK